MRAIVIHNWTNLWTMGVIENTSLLKMVRVMLEVMVIIEIQLLVYFRTTGVKKRCSLEPWRNRMMRKLTQLVMGTITILRIIIGRLMAMIRKMT